MFVCIYQCWLVCSFKTFHFEYTAFMTFLLFFVLALKKASQYQAKTLLYAGVGNCVNNCINRLKTRNAILG